MNDEYLWDKSGEPDPEIQELEQILGTLRYQPNTLVLPDDAQPLKRNHRLPLIAIAASLLVALLTAGLWLIVTKKPEQQLNAKTNVPPAPSPVPEQVSKTVKNSGEGIVSFKALEHERNTVVKNVRRSSRMATPSLTMEEREQALQVKQQLMVALRVASEKLNLAHRKTQGPSPNQIRNQHKVG